MIQTHFDSSSGSVPAARRFAIGTLHDVSSQVTHTVAMIVTELASNCVRHAASSGFAVKIDQTAGAVQIEVTDNGGGTPAPRAVRPTDPSGRGLQIVKALADAWGVVDTADGTGKTVWATVLLPEPEKARTRTASRAR
jgi:two-component sensor histidine kinase